MRMSQAIAATVFGLALDGCSAVNSNLPNLNVPNIDLFDPPSTATLTIESTPPGAEARPSSGGLCRTPCALPVPLNEGFTVTYTLEGYLPQTVSVRSITLKKCLCHSGYQYTSCVCLAYFWVFDGTDERHQGRVMAVLTASGRNLIHLQRRLSPFAAGRCPIGPRSPCSRVSGRSACQHTRARECLGREKHAASKFPPG